VTVKKLTLLVELERPLGQELRVTHNFFIHGDIAEYDYVGASLYGNPPWPASTGRGGQIDGALFASRINGYQAGLAVSTTPPKIIIVRVRKSS
jgi:hypothetical protein